MNSICDQAIKKEKKYKRPINMQKDTQLLRNQINDTKENRRAFSPLRLSGTGICPHYNWEFGGGHQRIIYT